MIVLGSEELVEREITDDSSRVETGSRHSIAVGSQVDMTADTEERN